MEKLNEIITLIKKRPEMYLGKKSLVNLNWYLEGYSASRNYVEDTEFRFLEEFQKFVEEKYEIHKYNLRFKKSYVEILNFFIWKEELAFNEFFRLYDEFAKLKN